MATPEDLKDYIKPGSETHGKLLEHCRALLSFSEEKMSQFYGRWNMRELQYQAYVPEKDWNKVWEELQQNRGKEASVQKLVPTLVVPYIFSTIRTIVTYLCTVFLARKPVFTIAANKAEFVENARTMESLLQYQVEHSKFVMHCTQWLYNGEIYGLGVMRTQFENQYRKKKVYVPNPADYLNPIETTEDVLAYQGNAVENIDPFLFFPDPRVPMNKVAKEGEFVFWRQFVGKFALEKTGEYDWLDDISGMPNDSGNDSLRNIRALGDGLTSSRGQNLLGNYATSNFVQIDEGTLELVPSKWGLGDGDKPEKWLVTIANKSQIIRLEPFGADHDMHPVAVNEPYGLGGFGNLGIADYLSPLQEMISWLLNSHIQNVKGALNNSFIYDPSMINEKDLISDAPNKCIRVRPKAFGVDVSMYFKQLDVHDVTQSHLSDMQVIQRIGDSLSAINENYRGLQDSGGRKTATEIRATVEAATSRLANHAMYISATGMTDLATQWTLNNQQYISDPFVMTLLGQDGANHPVRIEPATLNGDFYFPHYDGTLPVDKIALFDLWTQMLQFVQSDPEFRQAYSLPKIFEYVAKLGGASNVEQFRVVQGGAPEELQAEAQKGNLVPAGVPVLSTNAATQSPAQIINTVNPGGASALSAIF